MQGTKPQPTVTIGIPALNEEQNIGKLLNALLTQRQDSYSLERIIVVSDGSTDRTNEIVTSYPKDMVTLVALEKQSGVANAQNIIARNATTDVIVLVDADVLPDHDGLIEALVQPFIQQSDTYLVSGPALPISPKTFFEKVIAVSEECKTEAFSKTRGGNTLYCCRGRVCALARPFYTKITWPNKHADDSYSYLLCKQIGGRFVYAPDAIVRFRAPQNFSDHKKQSIRYMQGRFKNSDFDGVDVKKEYTLDKRVFTKTGWKYFKKHPVLFISYLGVLLFVRTQARFQALPQDSSIWTPIKSSKDI